MERLKRIKHPPLKDSTVILSNWYLKTKVTECTATEEPPRKKLYILRCSDQIWRRTTTGMFMNPIPVHRNLVTQHGVSGMARTPRRKYKNICNRNTNKNWFVKLGISSSWVNNLSSGTRKPLRRKHYTQ